jgi:hypothetical protein
VCTSPPIHFSAAKLWSRGRDGPRRGPDSVVIRGDSIVVQDSKSGANSNEIGVVDAATGRLRWSVDQLHALPGMPEATRWWHTDADPSAVGQGADWSVLVGYVRSSRSPYSRADEFGVAALSGSDGHVRWMTPIVPSVASPASHIAELVAANDTVALLDVNNERGDAAPMLAAVDATTGKQLWTRTGAEAAALAGNTTPAVAAAGGVALIPTSGIHERVVDLRTGHELAGVDTITPCVIDDHPDGDGLVACLSADLDPGSGYRVESFRPGDHEFRVSKRLVHLSVPSLPILDTVWKGYVFIDAGQPDRHRHGSADRPGRRRRRQHRGHGRPRAGTGDQRPVRGVRVHQACLRRICGAARHALAPRRSPDSPDAVGRGGYLFGAHDYVMNSIPVLRSSPPGRTCS